MESISEERMPLLSTFLVVYKLALSCVDRKQFNYSKSDFIILSALLYREHLCMSQLAECISSSKEQATRAVSALVDERLVERYEEPANRKLVHVRLTDEGRKKADALRESFRSCVDEKLLSQLSPEDVARLDRSSREIVEILGKLK